MPPTRALLTATVLAMVIPLAACTPEDPAPTPPTTTPVTTSATPTTTPSPSPTTSPSPTASFPTPAESEAEAAAAIRAGWEKYWTVLDKYGADPTLTDLQETQTVTVGEAADTLPNEIIELREANLKMVGCRTFRDVLIGEPVANADGVTVAEVTYCRDDSGVDLVDITTGEPSGRKPEVLTFKGVATMELLPDGIWRLATKRDETASC